MAERKINLTKNIISNQKAQEMLDGFFEEIIISDEKFDDSKIKKIYEDLFYQIPKKGEEESHESIINQSHAVVHPDDEIDKDDEIKSLDNFLLNKNEEFNKLIIPKLTNENPIFPNGVFIQEGSQITGADNEGSPIWFIQEGLKRQINQNGPKNWTKVIRKTLGDTLLSIDNQEIPIGNSPLMKFSPASDINEIDEGNDIITGADLSITPIVVKNNQSFIYSLLKLRVWCEGVERYYKFSNLEMNIEESEGRFEPGYWYMDTNGFCEMESQTDTDPTITFTPESTPLIWRSGTTLDVEISRDPILFGGDNVTPSNPSHYNTSYPTEYEQRSPDNLATEYPSIRVRKDWGPGYKFPGIINMRKGSRVKYRILLPDVIAGLTNMGEGEEMGYLYGIDNVDDQSKEIGYYDKASAYGNRMINNYCWGPISSSQCFGSLGQSAGMMNKCKLDSPTAPYYKWDYQSSLGDEDNDGSIKGKVYGQPILRAKIDKNDDNRVYCVFLGAYKNNSGLTDWNVFLDLQGGGSFRIKNKNLDQQVKGYKRDSTSVFNWLSEEEGNYLNNPTLYFPGLKGKTINYRHTDLDPNPEESAVGFVISSTLTGFAATLSQLTGIAALFPDWAEDNNFYAQIEQILTQSDGYLEDNIFNPSSIGSNFTNVLRQLLRMYDDSSHRSS